MKQFWSSTWMRSGKCQLKNTWCSAWTFMQGQHLVSCDNLDWLLISSVTWCTFWMSESKYLSFIDMHSFWIDIMNNEHELYGTNLGDLFLQVAWHRGNLFHEDSEFVDPKAVANPDCSELSVGIHLSYEMGRMMIVHRWLMNLCDRWLMNLHQHSPKDLVIITIKLTYDL